MRRDVVAKRIIQGVAVAFGVLGLMAIFLGLYAAVTDVGEANRLALSYMLLPLIVLGGMAVRIAWLNLRHFGPRSIRLITGLVVVFICLNVMVFWDPWDTDVTDPRLEFLYEFISLMSLLLMYGLYRVLRHKLIQLTGVADGEGGDPTLLSNAGSDASCEER